MAKSKKSRQADGLATTPEIPLMTTADKLPRQMESPQDGNGHLTTESPPEQVNEAIRLFEESRRLKSLTEERETPRPTGPRKRDVEDGRTVYTGPNARLTLDGGDTFNLETKSPLAGELADKAAAHGFDQIAANHWQASKQTVQATGKDPSLLAIMADGKGQRIGRAR